MRNHTPFDPSLPQELIQFIAQFLPLPEVIKHQRINKANWQEALREDSWWNNIYLPQILHPLALEQLKLYKPSEVTWTDFVSRYRSLIEGLAQTYPPSLALSAPDAIKEYLSQTILININTEIENGNFNSFKNFIALPENKLTSSKIIELLEPAALYANQSAQDADALLAQREEIFLYLLQSFFQCCQKESLENHSTAITLDKHINLADTLSACDAYLLEGIKQNYKTEIEGLQQSASAASPQQQTLLINYCFALLTICCSNPAKNDTSDFAMANVALQILKTLPNFGPEQNPAPREYFKELAPRLRDLGIKFFNQKDLIQAEVCYQLALKFNLNAVPSNTCFDIFCRCQLIVAKQLMQKPQEVIEEEWRSVQSKLQNLPQGESDSFTKQLQSLSQVFNEIGLASYSKSLITAANDKREKNISPFFAPDKQPSMQATASSEKYENPSLAASIG
jgi:hypothetical protein